MRSLSGKDFHLDATAHIFRDQNGSNEVIRFTPSTDSVSVAGHVTASKNIVSTGANALISGSSTSTGSFAMGNFADKLGIGNTAPVSDNSLAAFIHVGSSAAGRAGIALQDNENKFEIFTTDSALKFSDGTTERMRLDNNGNLGIGTNNPGNKLDVVGIVEINASGQHIKLDTLGAGQNNWITWLDNGSNKWEVNKDTSHNFNVYSYQASANLMQFLAAGTTLEFPAANFKISGSSTSTGSFGNIQLADVTAASNTITNFYEEGTWTPLPADASSGGNTAAAGTATGHYTRIGRIVHCEFTLININTTGMTSGNDFFIQGLPFTVGVHAGHAHGSVALENVNFTGEYVTISPAGGTKAIRLAEVPDNGNIDIVMVSEINDDSADIYGHFTYMA